MGNGWPSLEKQTITNKVRKIENLEFFIYKLTGSNLRLKRAYTLSVKPKLVELIDLIEKELAE